MNTAQVLAVEVVHHGFVAHHRLPCPAPGEVLELGEPVGQGGFGDVVRLGGAPPPPATSRVLVKRYDAQTVGDGALVRRSVAALGDALDRHGPAGWQDRLLALPYWLGRIATPSGDRLAALMIDLGHRGYVPCTFDPIEASRHRRWPLRGRLDLAASFASACADLEAVGYLHSDLNPENLLLSFADGDAQIIDLDSGVVTGPVPTEPGPAGPLTAGKADEFLPPEVRDPSAPGALALDRLTSAAERWSVASLVGYLVFAIHPGFFLRSLSGRTLDAYAASGRDWPDIDTSGPLFTDREAGRRAYPIAAGEFAALPPALLDQFRRLFRAGTDAAARPSAADWSKALADMRQPPELIDLIVSPRRVLEGDLVTVSWTCRHTTSVSALGNDRLPATGTVFWQADRSRALQLTLVNATAALTVDAPTVEVISRPRVEDLPVGEPDVPDHLLTTSIGAAMGVEAGGPGGPQVAPAPGPGILPARRQAAGERRPPLPRPARLTRRTAFPRRSVPPLPRRAPIVLGRPRLPWSGPGLAPAGPCPSQLAEEGR